MGKKGVTIFDSLIWIIVAPIIVVVLLSLLQPVTKQTIDYRKTVAKQKDEILLDQSITNDLMRGNEVSISSRLIINDATYYKQGDDLIRLYDGKRYNLGKGDFKAELNDNKLKVYYNDSEFVYDIYWSQLPND